MELPVCRSLLFTHISAVCTVYFSLSKCKFAPFGVALDVMSEYVVLRAVCLTILMQMR